MRKINFIFVVIAILLFQNTLNAQLYWSESFGNYTDGQIISGTNRWDMQNATAGYAPASTSPLTYGSLQSNAEYFTGGGGWTGAGVVVPMTYPSQYFDDFNGDGQWLTCGYKTGGSNELWFSVLVRPDVNADFQIWLNSSHIAWETKSGNLNIIRSAGKWGLGINGTNTLSSIDATVGSTYLIAAKVNFASSNTTITLYVNPTLGVTPATAAATSSSTSPLLFYSIGMYLNSNANSVSIDEMRIGKTFADVTPLVADVTSPSTPNGLSSSSITSTSYTLSWNASTDNVGVTAYDVYKDGVKVGTTASTSMNITGLSPSTTYAMTVIAKDAAGNASSASTALNVSTNAAISDVSPPSTPSNLSSSSISITGFTLSWNASTDNVGVIAYDVYKDGTKIGSTASTSLNITGLSGSSTYAMTVVARDAADNASSASTALNVTTLDAPLITDGGFEALVVNGTQQIPQGSAWSFVGRWNNCGITSEAGHYAPIIYDGNQTAFFMDDDTHSSSISQTVTLKKGTYAFSIWASLPSWQSGAQPLKLSVGNVTYDIPMQNAHPGQWEKIMTNFDISSQGSYVLKIWANLASGNQIYINFDDASLQDITPAASPITVNSNTNISSLSTNSDIDVTVASNGILTADATKTINNLVVESGGKVNSTTATLTVNNVVLKADFDTSPSVVVDHAMSISGTATLQKTLDNSKWFFVSFPCDVAVDGITKISGTGTLTTLGIGASSNWWIKYYNGATRAQNLGTSSNWVNVVAGGTLYANQGYIIGLDNSLTGNYVLSFPLSNTLFTAAEVDRKVTVGTYGEGLVPANHVGWNLVGSPYLSRFSGSGVNANFLTFHNGSSYTQLQKGSVSGIEPFTAFFIQASSGTTGTLLDFALAGRQTVRSLVNTSTADNIKLSLQNGFNSDYTSLILDDAQSSTYQVGQDLEKWITTGTNQPQVYSILNGINFAYNALPISAVNNIPIGFYTKTAGNSTIHVDASQATGISQLLLKDNVTGATVDLLQTDYSFTATAGTTTNRLVLNARKVVTDKPEINNHEGEPQVLINNSKLIINNLTENATVRVYDMVGHLIYNQQPTSSSVEIPVKVAGVYSIQLQTGNRTWTQKVVVK